MSKGEVPFADPEEVVNEFRQPAKEILIHSHNDPVTHAGSPVAART
jgi:hypothetical protein